ncbi:hypothetical protein [Poriferisphaera sp. WC338]|uniref:hypothetical protein n=1 Tax=Poriferisphaera sp. WC338 TaxID=3425129 RepID=UPI003D819E77
MHYLVDGHVHVRHGVRGEDVLDVAQRNFQAAHERMGIGEARYVLMMAETGDERFYQRCDKGEVMGKWRLARKGEARLRVMKHEDGGEVGIIGGRQLVTAENLEMLATGCDLQGPSEEMPLELLAQTILVGDRVVILPWGLGKWTGHRREVIEKALDSLDSKDVYLGDTPLREGLFAQRKMMSKLENKGFKVLPGSDALPISDGYVRTGAYGFCVEGAGGEDWFSEIRDGLRGDVKVFRGRMGLFAIVWTQLRLMMGKWFKKHG